MFKDGVSLRKSKVFAIRIVKMYKFLTKERNEYVLSKQVLRSGTSIGANLREAAYAQSHSDFYSKVSIALKEAAETEYWLELFSRTNLLPSDSIRSLQNQCGTIRRLLISSITTTKQKG